MEQNKEPVWMRVADSQLRAVWKCEDESCDIPETARVAPSTYGIDNYGEGGIPTCNHCDSEMVYQYTELLTPPLLVCENKFTEDGEIFRAQAGKLVKLEVPGGTLTLNSDHCPEQDWANLSEAADLGRGISVTQENRLGVTADILLLQLRYSGLYEHLISKTMKHVIAQAKQCGYSMLVIDPTGPYFDEFEDCAFDDGESGNTGG